MTLLLERQMGENSSNVRSVKGIADDREKGVGKKEVRPRTRSQRYRYRVTPKQLQFKPTRKISEGEVIFHKSEETKSPYMQPEDHP